MDRAAHHRSDPRATVVRRVDRRDGRRAGRGRTFLTFQTFNVVGLVTNLLAVPVAGFVMLAGLPVMGVCGLLVDVGVPMADDLARVAMVPLRLAVRWVWWVAIVASRL